MSDQAESLDLAPAEGNWLWRLVGALATDGEQSSHDIHQQITEVAVRLARKVCERGTIAESHQSLFVERLGRCLVYHAPAMAARRRSGLRALLAAAEQDELVTGCWQGNLLFDVMLAQALELQDARAAAWFSAEMQPRVMAWAMRMRGHAGADLVDNFAAELFIPRTAGGARIAGYEGRTSLAAWLKTVVANFLVSHARKKSALTGVELPELSVHQNHEPERAECARLLQPIVPQAMAAADQGAVLLIKLLWIDHVPQSQLATRFGKASGTLTRRHQAAVAKIVQALQRLVAEDPCARRVDECLQLLLAGEDRDLSQHIGELMRQAIENRAKEVS